MALLNLTKIRTPRPIQLPTINITAWWRRTRTAIHTYAGFTCITTAAFTTLPQLGWLTAGVALLALEYLGGNESDRP